MLRFTTTEIEWIYCEICFLSNEVSFHQKYLRFLVAEFYILVFVNDWKFVKRYFRFKIFSEGLT